MVDLPGELPGLNGLIKSKKVKLKSKKGIHLQCIPFLLVNPLSNLKKKATNLISRILFDTKETFVLTIIYLA